MFRRRERKRSSRTGARNREHRHSSPACDLSGLRRSHGALKIAIGKSDGNLFVKRSSVFYWLVGIIIATVAVAIAFYFDTAVSAFLVQHRNRVVYNFTYYVTLFGDWPEHIALGLVLAWVARRRGNQKWKRIFLSMVIALAIAGVSAHVIKIGVSRARPSVKSEQVEPWSRFSSHYHAFPSGHVAASTAFFGVLMLASWRIGLACLPIVILIAFSRLYLEAHYLSDVVCAAILGILSALLVVYFFLQPVRHPQSAIEN
jgi:membrane-associated phospholipid phosphatase